MAGYYPAIVTPPEETTRVAEPVTGAGRALAACLLALAVVTFALAAVRYLPSPLRFDEAEWAPQADGILRHGVPMILAAESPRLAIAPDEADAVRYGMWHPPVFLYSLALGRAALGTSTVAVRLVALLWGILALWLAWRTVARDMPASPLLRAVPLAIAVLSPLILDGLFYIDIDNTSMAAAVFAMALAHVRLDAERPWRRRVVLALLLTVALWSKLTTPLFMLAAIALHTWLLRGFRRACVDGFVIGAIGATCFAATFAAYCAAFHYPASFMFDVSYLGKRNMYSSVQPLARVLHAVWWNVVWVSPPLVLAGAWITVRRTRDIIRTRIARDSDLLLLFAAITFIEYALVGAMMGKYSAPAAIALAMAVGVGMARALMDVRAPNTWRVLGVALVVAALHALVIPPLVIRGAEGLSGVSPDALRNPRIWSLAVAVGVGLAAMSLWRRMLVAGAPARLLVAALLWMLAANPVAQARVVLARADRSPLRPYVDYGFTEAVEWLNDHTRADDVIVCPKDIGVLLQGRRYYALDSLTVEALQDAATRPRVRYVVDSNAYPIIRDRTALERAGLDAVATAGDFVIYGRAVTSTPIGQVTPVPPRPQ